jgi:hypothetical protein
VRRGSLGRGAGGRPDSHPDADALSAAQLRRVRVPADADEPELVGPQGRRRGVRDHTGGGHRRRRRSAGRAHGEGITRLRAWGFDIDYDNFPISGHGFCATDFFTPWTLTFRAAGVNPQTPGDVIATRVVAPSGAGPTNAGYSFMAGTACTVPAAGCFGFGQWTFDFPPVPSTNVRWIGIQQKLGNNAADGHPCAKIVITEGDATTYDNVFYHRAAPTPTVNQDLQICIGTSSLASLDIDGNGSVQPLSDGLLVLRRKFGFSGATLASGAVGQGCTRCFGNSIQPYIDSFSELDVDKNGAIEALTDALMILRYLFGFRGPTLINGATGDGCTQCTAPQIEANIAALL